MTARQFYNKRLAQDDTITSVQLMEEYVKHVINSNFCKELPVDFDKCKVKELEYMHNRAIELINYAKSQIK